MLLCFPDMDTRVDFSTFFLIIIFPLVEERNKAMSTMQKVSFETLGQGAAIERADLELQRVLKNIQDPNTSYKVCREICIKVKIRPSEDRGAGQVEIQATSKLAPVTEHVTQVYIGKDMSGYPEISEIIETSLFDQVENVTPMTKKDGSNA